MYYIQVQKIGGLNKKAKMVSDKKKASKLELLQSKSIHTSNPHPHLYRNDQVQRH